MTNLLVALALLAPLAASFQLASPDDEPIEVQVQRPRVVAIALSELEFSGGAGAQEVAAAFRRAIRASGVFDVAPGPPRDGTPTWNVRCAVDGGAFGPVTARLTVTDAASRRVLLSEGHRGGARAVGHALADALHAYVRSSPPVFTAPLAAVRSAGGRHEIVVSDWDGGSPRAAYVENGPVLLHDWHPDGRRIAFTTWRTWKPELWVLDVQTGAAQPLVAIGELATGAAFSPDGNRLAFVAASAGEVDLYVSRADGSGARRLTSDAAIESSPSWSADGRRIAFVSSRRGRPHAYVMDAGGGDARPVTAGLVEEQEVRFAPRGNLMSVVGRSEDGDWAVYTVSPAAGDLVAVSSPSRSVPAASWAPDGELLACATAIGTLEIVSSDGERRTHTNVAGLRGLAWRAARGR